jgi:hypothetical protein
LRCDILKSAGEDKSKACATAAEPCFRRESGLLALLLLAWIVPRGNIYWITYFAEPCFLLLPGGGGGGLLHLYECHRQAITEAAAFGASSPDFWETSYFELLAHLNIVDFPVYLHPILLGALSYLTIEVVLRVGFVSETKA